jgi:DNA-binding CsgD family transcriptional regulator/tetratricopeptide (TPR) repeat protein
VVATAGSFVVATQADNPAMRRVSSPQFVGRAEELARLEAALTAAAGGEPRALLLGGEAGVGKTRLLAEFASHARSGGAHVLLGACPQVGDGALPYAPVSQALRQLVREVDPATLEVLLGAWRPEFARLVPDFGVPAPVEQAAGERARTQLFEGLQGLLERLAVERPLLLAVEDLHWADRSTLDVLSFLVASLAAAPVVLVATYRSDEVPHRHPLRSWLAELDRRPQVERLELGRLDHDELAALLTGILGTPPGPLVLEEVLARSQGNPFFAEEVLAQGLRGQRALSTTAHDLLAARIQVLSAPARQVLQVAAVAGRQVGHGLLAAAGNLDEPTLLGAVREAVEQQVLVADPDAEGYAFRHVLLREVVDADLLPGERRRLHAALARCLAAQPGLGGGGPAETAAEVAVHWDAAHDPGQALPAAVAAGVAAEQGLAFAEAQRHFERALDLWDQVPDVAAGLPLDRVAVLERAARAAWWSWEGQRAVALLREALSSADAAADPVRVGLLYRRLAQYLHVRSAAESLEALEAAVALVPAEPASAERARVLVEHADTQLMLSRPRAARASAAEALLTAQRVGARREEGLARAALGCSLELVGERAAGLEQLSEARRIAEELRDRDSLAVVWAFLPAVLARAGRPQEALATLEDGMQALRRLGVARGMADFIPTPAVEVLLRLGRWEEADRVLEQAEAVAGMDAHLALLRAELELGRGDLATAAVRLDDVGGWLGWPAYDAWVARLRAMLALRQGDHEHARALVTQGLEQVAGSEEEPELSSALLALGLSVEAEIAEQARSRRAPAAVAVAQRAGAQLLGRLRDLHQWVAAQAIGPVPELDAHVVLGEAESTRLDGRSDPLRWAAAAAAWDDLTQPYPAAYARWRRAEALLTGQGSRAAATTALRQAHDTAEQLGAAPLRREVEGLARRARIDLAAPPAADQTTPRRPADPFGLTAREREVLALVADGRSNREIGEALFISAKTASVHISNILRKLQVTSRVQAATAAHRLGLLDEDQTKR